MRGCAPCESTQDTKRPYTPYTGRQHNFFFANQPNAIAYESIVCAVYVIWLGMSAQFASSKISIVGDNRADHKRKNTKLLMKGKVHTVDLKRKTPSCMCGYVCIMFAGATPYNPYIIHNQQLTAAATAA